MNTVEKDFKEWFEASKYSRKSNHWNSDLEAAWQAAAKKYQDEIAELKTYMQELYDLRYKNKKIKKLESEKAKLVECVEFYADNDSWFGFEPCIDVEDWHEIREPLSWTGGKRARQCLRELEK